MLSYLRMSRFSSAKLPYRVKMQNAVYVCAMIYVVPYSYFLGDIPYREAIAVFSSANRGAKSKVKLNVHTFNWSPRQSAFVCG